MPIDPFTKAEISDKYKEYLDLYEKMYAKTKTDTPTIWTTIGDLKKKGKQKSTLSLEVETDLIQPYVNPSPDLEPTMPFKPKKVGQPKLDADSNLSVVGKELAEMINQANDQGLTVPVSIYRAYYRIQELEHKISYQGDGSQSHKNGYYDGYNDAKNNYTNIYELDPELEEEPEF